MTEQKKIEKAIGQVHACMHVECLLDTRKIVIEALEKQIPKKPIYEGDGNEQFIYDTWFCPSCGENYEADFDEYDYCSYCGQRIDWSEKNG